MLSAVQWKKSNKISFQIEKRREKSTDRVTVRSTSARRLTNIDFCLSARMLRCGVFVVARFFYEFTSFLFCFCVSSFPLKRIMCLIRFRNFFSFSFVSISIPQLHWNIYPICFLPKRERRTPISGLDYDKLDMCIEFTYDERNDVAGMSGDILLANGMTALVRFFDFLHDSIHSIDDRKSLFHFSLYLFLPHTM